MSYKEFKNGRIKDPVARRVEQNRLNRLRAIKSSVKLRGLNKARRAATRNIDKRLGTRQKGVLKDITNNGGSKWTGLHDSANELLKRAQKHAKSSKLFQQHDDEPDELEASFDTLWNFHAQKNGIQNRNEMGSDSEGGDLEDINNDRDATGLIAPLGSARCEKYTARSSKSTKSVKLDDAAAEAFQNAWSAATPFNLHDEALNDSRVEESDGLFGGERRKMKTMFAKGGKSKNGKRPNLNKMEKDWESRGLPSWSNTVSQNPNNNNNSSNSNNANSNNIRSRQQSPETTLDDQIPDINPLNFDVLNVKRRSDDGRDILNQLADVGGDGEGVIDGLIDDDGSYDISSETYGKNKKMESSKSRPNLFRSTASSSSLQQQQSSKPHYSTRTKTSMNKKLKPINNRNENEHENNKRGSWRGGGSSDPHLQEERERVLEVKKREQKAAREQARKWRKRRQVQNKKEQMAAKTAAPQEAQEEVSKVVETDNLKETMPSKRGNSMKALKSEAEEAQAMLAEVMKGVADTTESDSTISEEENTYEREEDDGNSMIPTPIKNSEKFAYLNKNLHMDSPEKQQEDSPFLQRSVSVTESEEIIAEAPESNTPSPSAAPPLVDGGMNQLVDIPKLDLGGVEPDVSDDEVDEDEPLFE
jgi:hypothetical protein